MVGENRRRNEVLQGFLETERHTSGDHSNEDRNLPRHLLWFFPYQPLSSLPRHLNCNHGTALPTVQTPCSRCRLVAVTCRVKDFFDAISPDGMPTAQFSAWPNRLPYGTRRTALNFPAPSNHSSPLPCPYHMSPRQARLLLGFI